MDEERRKSFMALYEPNHPRFERFCKARVYGEMDFKDLLHDTVVVAFQKFETLKDQKSFLSFLFGIAIRILANNKRKKDKSTAQLNEILPTDLQIDTTTQKQEVDFLYMGLSLLTDVQRESIILFEIVGYSIKEIADLHNVGESAVKQRLSRGRSELKEILTRSINQKNSI